MEKGFEDSITEDDYDRKDIKSVTLLQLNKEEKHLKQYEIESSGYSLGEALP